MLGMILAVAMAASTPPNTPPTFTPGGPFNLVCGDPVQHVQIATIDDKEDSPGKLKLIYSSQFSGPSVGNITNNNGVVTADIVAGTNTPPATYSFGLIVQDSGGLAVTGYYIIHVSAVPNGVPVVNPTPVACTAGAPPSNCVLAGVSDAEDAAGSLSVGVTGLPPNMFVTSVQNTNGVVSANVEATSYVASGNYTVKLLVTNSGGFVGSALVPVTVIAAGGGTGGTGGGNPPPGSGQTGGATGCAAGGGAGWAFWIIAVLGGLLVACRVAVRNSKCFGRTQ